MPALAALQASLETARALRGRSSDEIAPVAAAALTEARMQLAHVLQAADPTLSPRAATDTASILLDQLREDVLGARPFDRDYLIAVTQFAHACGMFAGTIQQETDQQALATAAALLDQLHDISTRETTIPSLDEQQDLARFLQAAEPTLSHEQALVRAATLLTQLPPDTHDTPPPDHTRAEVEAQLADTADTLARPTPLAPLTPLTPPMDTAPRAALVVAFLSADHPVQQDLAQELERLFPSSSPVPSPPPPPRLIRDTSSERPRATTDGEKRKGADPDRGGGR